MTRAFAPLSIALFAFTSVASPTAAHAQDVPMGVQQSSQPRNVRSIAITATDRVIRPADVATVHIGYQIYGADQVSLYTQAAKTSNAIIDALRGAGVANDSIESEQQSVGPTESYQLNQLTPAERDSHAFIAQQSWTVRSTPADAARIIDLAAKAGGNKSGQIDWSLSDPNAASAEAAAHALQRAKAQAQAMATGLNVHLGQLLYASNQVEAEPIRPVPMMAMAKAAAPPPRPLAINDRQIETSATVYAVFAIE
ncbi:MAG TPA: SIMPL domain-containing protein [Bryocella sp.]|nr:SIMPL domain-containing protein [Bryocella sp.]